ncbi:MAG: DUF4080 domain-containing protein [Planctomycetaceae bacterium]
MSDIVLATLNAKYAHASFGLRYLLANLAELRPRAELLEFDISQRTVDLLEALLARQPRILGLGVYIWNVEPLTRLVADLKRLAPEICVVLGGPEVSHEWEGLEIVALADHVITGEGDLAFRDLCRQLLAPPTSGIASREATSQPSGSDRLLAHPPAGGLKLPVALEGELSARPPKIIAASLPQFEQLVLPYELYTETDLAHRVVYVEASRGCPYECEFCLSALEIPVRQAPLEPFLAALDSLLERGLRQFKFVDRTFNLNLKTSAAILDFFWERMRPGLFVHFEMIPDRLPEGLRERIARFPPGVLQFEVGIQTLNPAVAARISRRQNLEQTAANLQWLRASTGVHVHADLIVGLPGETLESFGAGFDRLVGWNPQEIQVGMLKRLRGAPIARHTAEWGMVYSASPPYEVLQTSVIDQVQMQRLRRFARYWDLVANSGNFVESTPLLWSEGSPFAGFLAFSDWLYATAGQTSGIALKRLSELVFRYLTDRQGLAPDLVAPRLWNDYQRGGKSDLPPFLRPHLPGVKPSRVRDATGEPAAPRRQARHVG